MKDINELYDFLRETFKEINNMIYINSLQSDLFLKIRGLSFKID